MFLPKTYEARRRQGKLSPYIWRVINNMNDGEHKIKPQDFLVLVNAELQKEGFDHTTVRCVANILVRGIYRWFNKENFNHYRIRKFPHNYPRIAEDLLNADQIKELPAEYQRPPGY